MKQIKTSELTGMALIEPYRKDAERLDWLMLNVNCDEIGALPKLPFGLSLEEHLSAFRAAIDAAIAAKGGLVKKPETVISGADYLAPTDGPFN